MKWWQKCTGDCTRSKNSIVYSFLNANVMYNVVTCRVGYSDFSKSPFSFCARSCSMICLLQLVTS